MAKTGQGDPFRHVDWRKHDHLFLSHNDREVAEIVGCAVQSAYARRQKIIGPKFCRVDWGYWDKLIGKLPDTEIARRANCDPATVWRRKKTLAAKPEGFAAFDSLMQKLVRVPIAEIPKASKPAKKKPKRR